MRKQEKMVINRISNHSECYDRLVQIFIVAKILDELQRLFLSRLSIYINIQSDDCGNY